MKNALVLAAFALCLGIPAVAESSPEIFTARVVHQDLGTYNGGSAVVPLYGALIAVPITRRSNEVLLQTAHHRLELTETPRDRHFVVLTIDGTVTVAREKQWFVILDSERKKHKFSLLSDQLTDVPQEK